MKTVETAALARCAILLITVVGLTTGPSAALAQEKGSEKLMKLSRIETTADAATVAPGDTIVMSCPKCKDTWVTVVEQTFKAASPTETHLVKKHQCPGCGTERLTTGHGKAKETSYVHVCKACGSEDANCCVMKKGTGPTKGMN